MRDVYSEYFSLRIFIFSNNLKRIEFDTTYWYPYPWRQCPDQIILHIERIHCAIALTFFRIAIAIIIHIGFS